MPWTKSLSTKKTEADYQSEAAWPDIPQRLSGQAASFTLLPPHLLHLADSLSPRAALLFLVISLTVGFSALVHGSHRPDWSEPTGFSLLEHPSSPNLNSSNSAETPRLFPALAFQPELDLEDDTDLPIPATIEPVHASEMRVEDFLSYSSHRGETPMKRTWRFYGYPAILTAMFAAAPANAAFPPPTDSEKLDDLQKQLTELKKTLASVQKSLDLVLNLDTQLRDLRIEANLNAEKGHTEINDLRQEITRLKLDVEQLSTRTNNTTRIAGSPPSSTLAPVGRVEMVNTFPEIVSIRVNRTIYTVRPNERRLSEPIPAGDFVYEVLTITEPRTRTLAANGVFTVNVYSMQ
jgi:hypothetical protein